MRLYLIFIGIVAVACGGCTTTTASRNQDAATAQLIAEYEAKQQARINQLNEDYQQVYTLEMDQLVALGKKQFDQQLQLQATHLSEQILKDWKNQTLPGILADSSYSALQDDYQKLNTIEANLQTARQTYNDSFSSIAMDMKKLDVIKSSLQNLAITPDTRKELEDFFSALYSAYQKSQKGNQTPSGNSSSSNK